MTNEMNIKFERAFNQVLMMLEFDDGSLGLISPIRQAAADAGIPNGEWPSFFDFCYERLGVSN